MAIEIDRYIYHSPVGDLLLGATSTHLVLCDWQDREGCSRKEVVNRLHRYGISFKERLVQGEVDSTSLLKKTIRQLDEYFQSTRRRFDLPLKTFGTPFQQQVWQQLQSIPYGTTMTYKEQAEVLGCPKAIRAVANANRLNAISIIIPCHRVIGTNRSLTGYAGGLDAKRWLIGQEQQNSVIHLQKF